jgi:hypothetical protein
MSRSSFGALLQFSPEKAETEQLYLPLLIQQKSSPWRD